MRQNKTFVIIGNSAAGLACIEAIREEDNVSEIINISKEPHRPYSRCLLTYYLAGSIGKDRLWIRPEKYYEEFKVKPFLGTEAVYIDEKNRKVELSDGKTIDYDKLLFAAGASSKTIDIKGVERKGVFYLRTIDDTEGMLSMLGEVKDATVLGGGLIGLRAALSLKKRGKNVTVIVKSSHILSQILDVESADMVRRHLEKNGIHILTGLASIEICGKGDTVESILLDDGTRLNSQMVIIGKGVSANIGLLKGKVKSERGVLVDSSLKTSNDGIYAAGDIAETFDVFEEKTEINAIWPAAVRQGKIAGLNMAGKKGIYEGSCGMNSIEFFGMSVISFGIVRPKEKNFEELIHANFSENIYRKVVLKDNRIVGGIFVNSVEQHGVILNLALQKADVSNIKNIFTDEYFDYGKIVPLVKRQAGKFKRLEYNDTCITYNSVL